MNHYSNFKTEDLSSLPTLPVSTHPSLPELALLHMAFLLYLRLTQKDPLKACGPDSIPAQVLRELAQDLTPMITHLFKQC